MLLLNDTLFGADYRILIKCLIVLMNSSAVLIACFAWYSSIDAVVLNFPNRLFAGRGKKQPVDEIRHENTVNTPFVIKEI